MLKLADFNIKEELIMNSPKFNFNEMYNLYRSYAESSLSYKSSLLTSIMHSEVHLNIYKTLRVINGNKS